MLLPDETYDERIEPATVTEVKQNPPIHNNKTSKSKSAKTKVKQPSNQRQRNDSLAGSAETASGTGSGDSSISSGGVISFPYCTSSFFTNILDTLGDVLPQSAQFSPHQQPAARQSDAEAPDECPHLSCSSCSESAVGPHSGLRLTANADMLRAVCDNFLRRHRIRPDFFCQYQQAIR